MSEPAAPGASGSASLRAKVQSALPYSLGIALLQIALSLIGMVLLVRYLAPHEYGVWALFVSLSGLLNLWISFGYTHYIARFLPAREDRREVADIVWSILARRLLFSAAACALLVATFDLYAVRFELEGYWLHLAIYQVAVVASIGSLYLDLALRARFMQRQILFIQLANQGVVVSATLVGIALGQPFLYFVLVYTGAALFYLALFAGIFGASHGWPRAGGGGVPRVDSEVDYRRACYAQDYGIALLNADTYRYMVGYFASSVHVAIYAVAATIYSRFQQFLPMALFRSLLDATFFSRFEQTGDTRELNRMFRFLFTMNAITILGFAAFFVPLGHELLVAIFRDTYGEAYAAVLVFLAAMPFAAMPVDMVLKALLQARVLVYAQAPAFLSLTLGIPLVIHYGAAGMAFAAVLGAVLKNSIMFFFARRKMDLRLPAVALAKCLIAAGATAGLLAAIGEGLPLLVRLVLAPLVYALAVRLVQPLSADERGLLASMLPARLVGLVPVFVGSLERTAPR